MRVTERPDGSPHVRGEARSTAWSGYAATVLAVVFGLVSFYWAAGGTALLDTVGGALEEMARDRDPGLIAVVWAVGAVKIVGAVFSLALVQRWGQVFPRMPMLVLGWGGTVLLVGYGGVLVAVQALVALGVITPSTGPDWTALMWHLLVWDMSFLVWGILLGLATRHYGRNRPPRGTSA